MNNFAKKHLPKLYFDVKETLFPLKIGYSIYEGKSYMDHYFSPAYPRSLCFGKELTGTKTDIDTIIEYSFWYHADVSHLYELEHMWVFLYKKRTIKIEGSRHGSIVSLKFDKPIFIEPGKHGFFQEPLTKRFKNILEQLCLNPGTSGLSLDSILAPDFLELRGKLNRKYSNDKTLQKKVIEYLANYKMKPSFMFTKELDIDKEIFLEWNDFKLFVENYLLNQLKSLK